MLLACGLVQGGREGARALLMQFWTRMIDDGSFRAPMLIGGFSPAGSSVAFGPTLSRSGQFDPFDLDPLREMLTRDVDFAALRASNCPRLLIGATRVRDGRQQIFRNQDITADVVLASTCPPLVHCAVEIDGESYWDGGYSANPPLLGLVRDCETPDLLVVQVTPSRDTYVPITMAAIDRRIDQIVSNATLNAEIAALEWARAATASPRRLSNASDRSGRPCRRIESAQRRRPRAWFRHHAASERPECRPTLAEANPGSHVGVDFGATKGAARPTAAPRLFRPRCNALPHDEPAIATFRAPFPTPSG